MTPPSSSGLSFRGHSWSWWLGQATLYTLLWLSLIKLPSPPSTELDTSWQMVLSYAVDQGLIHGRDIVFTYGPMGYLMAASYIGALFDHFIVWQIVSNLLMAAGLYLFGRQLQGWRQALYYAYLFWFGSMYADAMQMNFIAIFGLMLAQPRYRYGPWIATIAAAFAVFSLIKFTNLMLCGFILATLSGYYALERAWRQLAWLVGSFLLVFLGGWIAYDHPLAALPDFLKYGLEVSLGYAGAMGVYEAPLMLAWGLIAAASVVIYGLWYWLTQPDRLRAAVVVLILFAVCFINWKHGFTRADGHVLAHFVMVLMVVCSYPALTQDTRRQDLGKTITLSAGGLACLAGIMLFLNHTVVQAPSNWNYRLRDTARALLDLPAYKAQMDRALRHVATLADYINIDGFVGDATVDHLGDDQGFTLLNRLNYTPRPAIQSYTTYTPALNRVDEAFYRSERAPRFVIQRLRSIDLRLPALDDSLTQRLIYQNYDYVLEEGGLILWERPDELIDPKVKLLGQTATAFDTWVDVPSTGDQPLWVRIDIEKTLLGRLRQFLYKPPTLFIDIEEANGRVESHLFVAAMGQTGFLLNPLFVTSNDVIQYQRTEDQRRPARFRLRTRAGGDPYWQEEIHVAFESIAPFKRAFRGITLASPHRLRAMMDRTPSRLEAEAPIGDAFIDGVHKLQMHARSVMEFPLQPDDRSLQAEFGIMEGAFTGPEGTDGVEFVVEYAAPDGSSDVLFRRLLEPRARAEDRGVQSLTVPLPSGPGGRVILRTLPGPSGASAWDWAYWSNIDFQ